MRGRYIVTKSWRERGEGGRVRERDGESEGVRDRERVLKRSTKWSKGVV
jgi:hypothetical protein